MIMLQKIDPCSQDFAFPKAKTAKELTRLLLARQKAVFNQTICDTQPELTEKILQRNFKLLLKKYDIELILRGLELSVLQAEFPSSTKYIEDRIEYYLELKKL